MKFETSLRWISCLSAVSLLALTACEQRAEMWQRTLRVEGPVAVEDHLVWLDRTTDALVLLDTTTDAAASRVQLAPRPRSMAVTGSHILVTAGTGEEPVLEIVSLEDGSATSLATGAEPYDLVWVSPTGDHAVLTHAMDSEGRGGLAARNLNRVAIVDLTVAPPAFEAVMLHTDSLAPRNVVFSSDGTLAAVQLDAAIAIVDVLNPTNNLRVPLRLPGGQRLQPRRVMFSQRGDYLYVMAGGTQDLLVLEIGQGDSLSATVNFLFVPGAVALEDILIPAGDEFDGYVAALFRRSTGSVAALLRASGDVSTGSQVELTRQATRLLDLGGGLVLVHGVASGSSYSRWVAGWEPLSVRAEEWELQGSYGDEPSIADGKAFFRHERVDIPEMGSVSAVTAVTLDESGARLRVRPSGIVLLGKPTAAVADDDGRYFVAVDIEREDSGAAADLRGRKSGRTGAVVAIDGVDLGIDGVTLDDRVKELGVVGDYLYAVHDKLLGDVTLIPRNELARDAARRYDGVLLSEILAATRDDR